MLNKKMTCIFLAFTILFSLFGLQPPAAHAQWVELSTTGGYLPNDTNPAQNIISYMNLSAKVNADTNNTTVGVDLGSHQHVNRLELWDSDASSSLVKEDYTVYVSSQNAKEYLNGVAVDLYALVTDWEFDTEVVGNRLVHRFEFPKGVYGRYLKVHVNKNNVPATFVINNSQIDLKAFSGSQPTTAEIANTPAQHINGFRNNDVNPASGALGTFGAIYGGAVDYKDNSFGVDLGSIKSVGRLEIRDKDTVTRVTYSDYLLYSSNDNVTYTPIPQFTFSTKVSDGRLTHILDFTGVEARYLKVKQNFSDTNYTFVLQNIQEDIKVYLSSEILERTPTFNGFISNDSSPLTTELSYLGYTGTIGIDVTNRSVGFDLGGKSTIRRIELVDQDNAARATAADYEVYAGDAKNVFALVTGWTFKSVVVNNRMVHIFTFDDLAGRYFKIRSKFTDTAYTFSLGNVQNDLLVYTDPHQVEPDVTRLPLTAGMRSGDTAPLTGAIGSWGVTDSVYVDRSNTSVGIDLGSKRTVNRIELSDSDEAGRGIATDYEIYCSDNNTDYKLVRRWEFKTAQVDGKLVHVFEFSDLSARYVKIRSKITDTAATFVLADPEKDVKAFVTTRAVPEYAEGRLYASVGYLNKDEAPAAGSLGNFGVTSAYAFDTDLRSIGAYLGVAKPFNKIRIFDEDEETRLRKMDFSLYTSNDNITYTKITDFDMYREGNVITFYNFSATARFVKVHQHNYDPSVLTGANATFIAPGGNLQNMLAVYNEADDVFLNSGGGEWLYRKSITLNNPDPVDQYDQPVFVSKAFLGTAGLIAAGKMKADYSDVRFSDSSGKELSFYMEADGFTVRVPYAAGSGNAAIYMNYGNKRAEPKNDGAGTFQVEYGTRTLSYSLLNNGDTKPVVLGDGKLALFYTKFPSYPSKAIRKVYMRKSENNGQTWGPEQMVTTSDLANMGGVLVSQSGDILVTYFESYGYDPNNVLDPTKTRVDLLSIRSTDGGVTWSTPSLINVSWNYNLSTTNPVLLANGDILITTHHLKDTDRSSGVSVMYSTDGGVTWSQSATDITIPSSGFEMGTSEASIIQLADGSLKMLMRQQSPDKYRLGESVSTDNGRTWTTTAYDSIVYSSNTQPAISRNGEDILLLWSGHNSLGGASYVRAPLTVAYSSDETASWRGYREVGGRTIASQPYGYPAMLQPDMAKASDGSAFFAWWERLIVTIPYANGAWYGMRIDDFDRWLYRSHGAFDDFEATDTDLNGNYWWELGHRMAITSDDKASGSRSLRFTDNNSSELSEVARTFPGIKKGTVSFQLKPVQTDSGFTFSLRETYSQGNTSPGTMFNFQVGTDGSLKVLDAAGIWNELPVPTDLAMGSWQKLDLRFDTSTGLCELFVNGSSKGVVGSFRNESIITYFYLSSENAAGNGTDVLIDDLIITDTEKQQLVPAALGSEQSLSLVALDSAPPVTTASVEGTKQGDWYKEAPLVKLIAADSLSGVLSTEYSMEEGGSWLAYSQPLLIEQEGVRTIRYRSVDVKGNAEQPKSVTVRYDRTAPTTVAEVAGQVGGEQWYTSNAWIKLNASDLYSGPFSTEYLLTVSQAVYGTPSGSGIDFSIYREPIVLTDGVYELAYRSMDNAGNMESEKRVSVAVDSQKPSYSLTVNGQPLTDGMIFEDSERILAELFLQDELSGVAVQRLLLDGAEVGSGTTIDLAGLLGTHSFRVIGADHAGNQLDVTVEFSVSTSLEALAALLERFQTTGDLQDPLFTQLNNNLLQAEHQFGKGSADQAAKHLEDFVKHLGNKPMQDLLTAKAKAVLTTDANALITEWSTTTSGN